MRQAQGKHMNDLTRRAVDEVLSKPGGKHAADLFIQEVERDFLARVMEERNTILIVEHGVKLKQRAIDLLAVFTPGCVDKDGIVEDYDTDCQLSYIVERTIERRVERDPGLQLDLTSVVPYLETKLQPQLSFFGQINVF